MYSSLTLNADNGRLEGPFALHGKATSVPVFIHQKTKTLVPMTAVLYAEWEED